MNLRDSNYGAPQPHPACRNAWEEDGYCGCYYCVANAPAAIPQHHHNYPHHYHHHHHHHHRQQQQQQQPYRYYQRYDQYQNQHRQEPPLHPASYEGSPGVVWRPAAKATYEYYHSIRSMEYHYDEGAEYYPPPPPPSLNHAVANSVWNRTTYQTREEDLLLRYENEQISLGIAAADSRMKVVESRGRNQGGSFLAYQQEMHDYFYESKKHQDVDDGARLTYDGLLFEEERHLSQKQEQSINDADYARKLGMKEMSLFSNSHEEEHALAAVPTATVECQSSETAQKVAVAPTASSDAAVETQEVQATVLTANKPEQPPVQEQETSESDDHQANQSTSPRSDAQVAQDLLEEESKEKRRARNLRNDFPIYTRVPQFQSGVVSSLAKVQKSQTNATPQASNTTKIDAAKAEALALELQKREAAAAYTTMGRRKQHSSAHNSLDLSNSFSSLSTGFIAEEEIAEVAKAFDDEEEQPTSQFRLYQEQVDMHATFAGRAWKFVEQVQELFLYFDSDNDFLKPVSLDMMMEQTEKLLKLQQEFRTGGKAEDCMVDLGYHYSRRENLDQIQMNGLLSNSEQEQTPDCRSVLYNGSVYGDGIYTSNNPFKFHGLYGNMGLLVVRLKGKTSYHPGKHHNNRTQWEDGDVDTKIIGTQPEDLYAQRVLLRSSSQCIPIFSFLASQLSIVQPQDRNNMELQRLHENLLALVDHIFNTDMV